MKNDYPVEYFQEVSQLGKVPANDLAASYLVEWQEKLEGVFEKPRLQLFENMLMHVYQKRNLSELCYFQLKQWLEKMYRDLADEMVPSRHYFRTVYGYGFFYSNGQKGYYVNARKDSAYFHRQKQLAQNVLVTPLIQETYWSNDDLSPKKAREYFRDELETILDDTYWEAWRFVKSLPAAMSDCINFREKKQEYVRNYGKSVGEAFQALCRSWDIQV